MYIIRDKLIFMTPVLKLYKFEPFRFVVSQKKKIVISHFLHK